MPAKGSAKLLDAERKITTPIVTIVTEPFSKNGSTLDKKVASWVWAECAKKCKKAGPANTNKITISEPMTGWIEHI